MSALFSLTTVLGLILVMWFAYVMARFITGYPGLYTDDQEARGR